jgi:hypothetical protein
MEGRLDYPVLHYVCSIARSVPRKNIGAQVEGRYIAPLHDLWGMNTQQP